MSFLSGRTGIIFAGRAVSGQILSIDVYKIDRVTFYGAPEEDFECDCDEGGGSLARGEVD